MHAWPLALSPHRRIAATLCACCPLLAALSRALVTQPALATRLGVQPDKARTAGGEHQHQHQHQQARVQRASVAAGQRGHAGLVRAGILRFSGPPQTLSD
jgi:hypothetical protein